MMFTKLPLIQVYWMDNRIKNINQETEIALPAINIQLQTIFQNHKNKTVLMNIIQIQIYMAK